METLIYRQVPIAHNVTFERVLQMGNSGGAFLMDGPKQLGVVSDFKSETNGDQDKLDDQNKLFADLVITDPNSFASAIAVGKIGLYCVVNDNGSINRVQMVDELDCGIVGIVPEAHDVSPFDDCLLVLTERASDNNNGQLSH